VRVGISFGIGSEMGNWWGVECFAPDCPSLPRGATMLLLKNARWASPMNLRSRYSRSFPLISTAVVSLLLVASAFADNPVPQVVGPPIPQAVVPGSGAFTLKVYGANFVSGAVVNWNRSSRSTTFISARELQAQILASDVAKATAGYITVTNPPPGGGVSSSSYGLVEVHTPTSTIAAKKPHGYLLDNPPSSLVLTDFNNDGILDFAASYGDSEIKVLLGKGDGTFAYGSVATYYYDGTDSAAIAAGDFNGDGNEDLVFGANPSGPPTHLGVSLGDGNGKFTKGARFWHYDTTATGMAVGDFSRDGNLDLATTTNCCTLSVFLGQGDGSFKHRADYYELGNYEVQTADFNGDGILDLVIVRDDRVNIRLGRGDGTFSASQLIDRNEQGIGCSFGPALFITDFNADGNADLAYCERDYSANKGKIWIALGNGDGTFKKPIAITVPAYTGAFSFAVGDFNSDGKTDLMANYFKASNPNETETDLFLGNGDGTFQRKKIIK
jgi:hypothetical protein